MLVFVAGCLVHVDDKLYSAFQQEHSPFWRHGDIATQKGNNAEVQMHVVHTSWYHAGLDR